MIGQPYFTGVRVGGMLKTLFNRFDLNNLGPYTPGANLLGKLLA